MTCGFWNVNGWTKNVDKNRLLSCCIIDSGLDIVGIAESHLRENDKQNRSTEGCSKLKRSVDMTSLGKNGLNIRTNASPKGDRTRCPEE